MSKPDLKDMIREEYARCASDPVHFFKKYAIIQHPTKGKMNFDLYPFQEKTLHEFQKHKYSIVLKGRQLGLSTLTAGFALWKMLFTDDYKVLVIATTQDVAKELVAKVQLMYEKLPTWIKQHAQENVFNKLELTFKNGSSIKAVSSSEKSARSPSISLLIIDEAAFIDRMEEIWTAAQATLSCVDFNTLVLTEHGLVRIGELFGDDSTIGFIPNDLNIINRYGDIEKSDSLYKSPESSVYEIELSDGNCISITENHPILCDIGWVRCDSLKVGMKVKCLQNTQVFGNKISYPTFNHRNDSNQLDDVSNEDLAYFYGLYIAEGHRGSKKVKNPTIGITNIDNEIHYFLNDKFNFKKYDDRHMTVNHAHLSMCMKFVGIDYSTAKYKKVPNKILSASKEEQIEFLRGLFDGDGCVTKSIVKFSSTSKQLVLDVYSMLLNFGIRSKIRHVQSSCKKSTVIKNVDYVYNGYDLIMYGKNARKYVNEIGFRLNRKISVLSQKSDGDYVEVCKDSVKNLILKSGYTLTYFKYNKVNITRLLYGGAKSITKNSIERLLENTDPSLSEWEELNNILNKHNSKEFFNEIVSIKYVGKRLTYDLKVPTTHSFIANGIINHNTGGGCILLSTPNGQGGLFHKIWMQATENFHDTTAQPFNPILLTWRLHPDRNKEWADTQKALLGARKFAQEHDGDFISSGHTVIDGEIIQWYKDNLMQEPLEKRYSGDMWIWKYPDYTKSYVLAADVARGDGADFSAFHVFDVDTMEQVASFRARIGTREYGNLLVSVATEYNQALLVIDNKNMGWDVVQVALDRSYPNLYYSYKNDPFFDENIHLRKNIDMKDKKDMIPGFTTGHKARMNMISKLEIYFREKSVIIHDIRTVNELFVFLWINGKPQAQDGYNDDLIMAMSMAMYVRDTALRLRQVGIELTKRALTNMHRSVYTPQRAGAANWKMKLGGNRGEDDLRWLL